MWRNPLVCLYLISVLLMCLLVLCLMPPYVMCYIMFLVFFFLKKCQRCQKKVSKKGKNMLGQFFLKNTTESAF